MAITEKRLWCCISLLVACCVWMQFHPGETGDKGWLLLATQMCLQGKTLYVDVVEINPPLIVWIYSIPVSIALYWHALTQYQALVVCGFAASVACIGVAVRVISFHPLFTGNPIRKAQFGLLLCFLFMFFIDTICFFDREHIFMMLVLPYLLRCMPSVANRPLPRPLVIVLSILAGLGFCIKPHCMLLLAGVQLVCAAQRRGFRVLWSAENFIIFTVIAGFIACVGYFTPAYATVIFPMALETYGSFNIRLQGFIENGIPAIALFLLIMASFRFREKSPWRADILYLLSLCLFCLLYALANNGWYYVYKPLFMLLFLSSFWLMEEYRWLKDNVPGGDERKFRGLFFCLAGFALGAISIFSSYATERIASTHISTESRITQEFVQAVEGRRAHSFGVLSTKIRPWVYVADHTHASWDTRFNQLWMLPKFMTADAGFVSRHQWIPDYVASSLAADLIRHNIEVVFVENSPQFYTTGKYVDLIGWMSESAVFKEAWRHYRLGRSIDYCPSEKSRQPSAAVRPGACRFDVYYRSP